MSHWIYLAGGLCLLMVSSGYCEEPLVAIEVAIVERSNVLPGAISISHELNSALADVDLVENGLIHFLQHWKSGTESTPVTVVTLRVKADLGARIEVHTQRILAPDPRDDKRGTLDRSSEHVGMDATLYSKAKENGQIELHCQFGKNSHSGRMTRHEGSEQSQGVSLPRIETTNMTSVLLLDPGKAYVSDPLLHSDEKSIRRETVWVCLVRLGEEQELPREFPTE